MRASLVVAVALVVVAGSSSRFTAIQPPEPEAGGFWNGFFTSMSTPGDQGVVRLDITAQKNRRFVGTLHVNPGSGFIIPFEGTLSASGQFSVVGKGAMGRFMVNGQYREVVRGVLRADATYRLWAAGAIDEGDLHLLQEPTQVRADLAGLWGGYYISDVFGTRGDVALSIEANDPRKGVPSRGTMTGRVGNMTFTFAIFHAPGGGRPVRHHRTGNRLDARVHHAVRAHHRRRERGRHS
ncbi:MAG TPA: hypothetical protein VEL51_23010 [Vicinamibacterales bacterium]|nr:hypothetical protein [Vicinamibacterales bacterium]